MNRSLADVAVDTAIVLMLALIAVASAFSFLLLAFLVAGWAGVVVMNLLLLGAGSFVRSLGR